MTVIHAPSQVKPFTFKLTVDGLFLHHLRKYRGNRHGPPRQGKAAILRPSLEEVAFHLSERGLPAEFRELEHRGRPGPDLPNTCCGSRRLGRTAPKRGSMTFGWPAGSGERATTSATRSSMRSR